MWNYVAETAEFWSDYMLSEVVDTFDDIWYDAKPIVREFIDGEDSIRQEKIEFKQNILEESGTNVNSFFQNEQLKLLWQNIVIRSALCVILKSCNKLIKIVLTLVGLPITFI